MEWIRLGETSDRYTRRLQLRQRAVSCSRGIMRHLCSAAATTVSAVPFRAVTLLLGAAGYEWDTLVTDWGAILD